MEVDMTVVNFEDMKKLMPKWSFTEAVSFLKTNVCKMLVILNKPTNESSYIKHSGRWPGLEFFLFHLKHQSSCLFAEPMKAKTDNSWH